MPRTVVEAYRMTVRRCTRCIMPDSFPHIHFDGDGVCSYCSNDEPLPVLGEDALKTLLDSKKGAIYDCVVPFSGGKDSTYVLYYLAAVLGKKVVAVNYDSGFQTDLAFENMETVCRNLHVPLVRITVDRTIHEEMIRTILTISQICGTFFGVCGNCETNIRTAALRTALEYGAPFIVYGSSRFESVSRRYKPDFLGLRAIFKKASEKGMASTVRVVHLLARYALMSLRQRQDIGVPLRYRFVPFGKIPYMKVAGVEHVFFYNYSDWDMARKIALLEEKTGWKHPKDRMNRFDCLLHCFGNHTWLHETGISLDGVNYATMVRQNKIDRKKALESEESVIRSVDGECEHALASIGMPPSRS